MTDYDKIEQIKLLVADLLAKMGVSATVEYEDSILKGLVFNISSRESRLLIGHQGATLHALETILHTLVSRRFRGEHILFTLDVDDYRRKREWHLRELAKEAVTQVKRVGRPVKMEPMPNYERRLVHSFLQETYPEVFSGSEGRDPNRRIVIQLK
jgi:spoIIIJ-associated protein